MAGDLDRVALMDAAVAETGLDDFGETWFSASVAAQLRLAFPHARLDNQRDDEDRPQRGVLVKSWDERGDG